ncbi:Aegerolysin family protein [Penicillium longicatenatum]|uniref:Aegerolysin family protein n=1 Tax=Penicillium longicatenatum TaxID=1561947 RepID=UPI002546813C|nr:Aegerolysin family protein [Penicillium longicatenatum]KAJ5643562.1 Aegerolysin family protein [Penicillium longicatenatum]
MVYSQWVVVEVYNKFRHSDITIKEATIDYGKYHENGNKDNNLEPEDINGIVIKPGKVGYVSACGKAEIHYGTDGTFALFDGSTKICKLFFDVPYHKSTNDFQVKDRNDDYAVSVSEWNREGGALGNVRVNVGKFG